MCETGWVLELRDGAWVVGFFAWIGYRDGYAYVAIGVWESLCLFASRTVLLHSAFPLV